MMEGSVLLNVYRKPDEYLARPRLLSVLHELFSSRDMTHNRLHVIGTESALAAVGLGNQEFEGLLGERLKLMQLAALVPEILPCAALGSTLLERGVSPDPASWQAVTDAIADAPLDLMEHFLARFDTLAGLTYGSRDPESLFRLWSSPGVRELIEEHSKSFANGIYVVADICRPELLFEVDGIAVRTSD